MSEGDSFDMERRALRLWLSLMGIRRRYCAGCEPVPGGRNGGRQRRNGLPELRRTVQALLAELGPPEE